MSYMSEYELWCKTVRDEDTINELENMSKEEIKNAFYKELDFGTGGLRGVIGAGTNKINIYTVAKASQGLSNYLLDRYGKKSSVVIGYDSRVKSDVFAKVAATVFAKNDIRVYMWDSLTPVPTVSFAIRYLGASAGVMLTASHNPSQYNGYKVYADDGCQITTESARSILGYINKVNVFTDVKRMDFTEAVKGEKISYIKNEVMTAYIECVKSQSVLFGEKINKNISIVYSPLNGAGYVPVMRVLKEAGFTDVTVVEEQRLPDGNFPTCPYPNPEVKEAMKLGIEYAKNKNADLLLATDPDCDRVGIAVKNSMGEYVLLSGNETGILLLDFICSQRVKNDKMPKDAVFMKTIVTTDLASKIAQNYGVKTVNVLTGFKFIGEQIGHLEEKGKEENYIFGFEESYGYLSGTYVRDKDGVNGAYLICEMFSYYKTHNINLTDKLSQLYDKFGYCLNTQHCFEFEGAEGFRKMQSIMDFFRTKVGCGKEISQLSGLKICKVEDYSKGIYNLPKSNVLKYTLDGGSSAVVRPSGTEPKLKLYFSVVAPDKKEAVVAEKKLSDVFSSYIKQSKG